MGKGADYDPSEYGSRAAADYDDVMSDLDPTAAVDTLADLAGSGPVLELGIGTGRIAIPLRQRSVEVAGIEGSVAMAQVLKGKPGGRDIPVTIGDFSEVRAPGEFSLVLLAFNTVFALPSQDMQVRCFRNAARHLTTGGAFVVEARIPDMGDFTNGRAVSPFTITTERVVLEVAEIFPSRQELRTSKIFIDGGGVRLVPAHHRYAWPAELDLMARLAGMELESRWADWHRSAFNDASHGHVTVWRKVADGAW